MLSMVRRSKNGDCAKDESCDFPQFNAMQLTTQKKELAERETKVETTSVKKGNTQGKRVKQR